MRLRDNRNKNRELKKKKDLFQFFLHLFLTLSLVSSIVETPHGHTLNHLPISTPIQLESDRSISGEQHKQDADNR